MSSKSKRRRPERVSMTKAVTAAEIMFVWAWMDVFRSRTEGKRHGAYIRAVYGFAKRTVIE
jgi:hypothetical protein